ncbi:hypothetical protein CI109_104417 [Kwoniella shandongensis]|uniref:Zn(2)-C6 fungal-type domain-containing protein n=1 Tax=Kwoniella shandongensis TaxID=1734106 RepID=A0AAJ8LNH6_9TREE
MSNPNGRSSGSATTGQRRPRPHSYTPQACERCRSRKQRCIMGDENEEACKNCLDSGSICVYAQKGEAAKRSRRETSQPVRSDEDGDSSPGLLPPPSSIPIPARPSLQTSPTSSSSHNPSIRSFAMSAPPVRPHHTQSASELGQPQTPMQPIQPWQDTIPQQNNTNPPTDVDWRAWLSQIAQQIPNGVMAPPPPPVVVQESPRRQIISPVQSDPPMGHPYSVELADNSPSRESDENSVFETAKGLAMISLEAAAEPHYVGESSGSLWTTLVAKGIPAPQVGISSKHVPHKPSRSPSPTRRAALRASLARPLPKDVADFVLQTVYCHLQSRYPFMDWLSFEKYWQVRDELFLSISQGRQLNKNASVAAFFLLMILAIGSQYCKYQSLPELLRPQDYYALASPYLPHIVQLHNLTNVQAVYSLRDSRGPSIWHLSGVCIRLVFWTCYTMDRMMSMLLGRPPGISDDDIDVELPDAYTPDSDLSLSVMRSGSMVSSVHYIKLKRIESQIQRAVYTVANRKPNRPPADFWPLLGMIDQWEAEIPPEASSEDCHSLPCCTKDWFCLRGVETRLSLLRPLCMDKEECTAVFLPHLAQNAARGCELHAIKAASNTLFAYSQHEQTAAALYDVFETLSAVCIDKVSSKSTQSPDVISANTGEWLKVSTDATSNIANAGEYVDLLRTLGIDISNTQPDTSWDLAAFSPGNLLFNSDQQTSEGQMMY